MINNLLNGHRPTCKMLCKFFTERTRIHDITEDNLLMSKPILKAEVT